MQKPIVIYHANCTDGLAAAWCFKHYFGDSMEYFPGVYGMPMPDIVDRTVYMVDFSYPANKMEEMCEYAERVVLIDHHKTALEALADFDKRFSNFDMSPSSLLNSGAGLAWSYVKDLVKHKDSIPMFLLHVQDRDLWEFKIPGTKAIVKGATASRLTLDNIGEFMKMKLNKLEIVEHRGNAILDYEMTIIKGIASECSRIITLDNNEVFQDFVLINAPGALFSELGDYVGKGIDVAGVAMYYDTPTHRVFGLRSNKAHGCDVSSFAKYYGGGGHRNAAGFKISRTDPMAFV